METLIIPKPIGNGLTLAEVEHSRKKFGGNIFTQKKRNGFLRQYLESFGDPIIKILLTTLAVNIIFMFRNHEWFETVGIAIAVLLATLVSTLSEYGSESAFQKLQEDSEKIQCRIRRSAGIFSIPVGEVVVGDLVLLQAGERIPADGILISGQLKVDQSALNGESRETLKRPVGETVSEWNLFAENQLFRGSIVASGEGIMQVCNVGDRTIYGGLARQLQEGERESPLKERLAGLARSISRLGYAAAALVALADLYNNILLDNQYRLPLVLAELTNFPMMMQNLLHAALLAITVVVVAVPEGLPMMITVVLSSNMFRMLKDHVMVRKLVGIETSGSLNILFTDKTGTLTRGNLSVSQFLSGDGREFPNALSLKQARPLWKMVELSCLYNTSSVVSQGKALGGNATDRALLNFSLPLDAGVHQYETVQAIPFDSVKKYSAVEIQGEQHFVLIKGSPEKLLPACTKYLDWDGTSRNMAKKGILEQKLIEMTQKSMRVLVLAVANQEIHTLDECHELTLIGLVGIRDELRREVAKAVQTVHAAGVQVVMITGDNRETAVAIAQEAGILSGAQEEKVLTSQELSALDDDRLQEILPDIRVIARALPEDKSRLVKAAQELGMVVGMTGDGINDAPALKKADVGFAMGSGTEVAKEAGDIVIMDDNFASIVKAILYGRTIFKSIRKFIVFQLTMNLCAVGVSVIGPFIGFDNPITVIQMLWVNIVMDTLGGLAFAGEAPLEEYMYESPKARTEPILTRSMELQILHMGIFTVTLCLLFLKLDMVKKWFYFQDDPMHFLTAFFALFIFAGIFNSFNARTPRINIFSNMINNSAFLFIMSVVALVQMIMIYYGGSLFRTTGLSIQELCYTILFASLVIPADLLRKIIAKRCNHIRRSQ
ncbi:calcium-translocating P-type ATPase, PMCA-type [Marasmitruncus massiliensis]|uniref:calcium-translocating P-type ATPase, PMCA-type n=1 Tax=Marasmitruncus massiliensis TaxID=1944642 RepID=UPI000C7E3DF1|nr:calcium-translocating P-type ATPase, PMCA-type [Marasmitruncus massiliensis]